MTTSRDPDRLIDAYLAEGPDRLPDRTYDTVRGDIDRTRQRVAIGPWREPNMNTIAKLAITLAAVVVVAIVGLNLLPEQGSVGGIAPTPSPTPSSTPTPTPAVTASPSPVVQYLPPVGPLAAGTYPAISEFDLVPFSFTVPEGWASEGWYISNDKQTNAETYDLRLSFVPIGNLYSDPCRATLASPVIGPTVDDLVAGLMAQPGSTGATTTDVEVGGRPAKLVEYTIATDYTCAVDRFMIWRDAFVGDLWTLPPYGDVVRFWVVDVDGVRFVITADIHASVTNAKAAELQDVIDSVTFGE